MANHLNVSMGSIPRWLKIYKNKQLEGLLTIYESVKQNKIITPFIAEKIKERVADPENPLYGYNYLVKWLKEEYNFHIGYQTLRS